MVNKHAQKAHRGLLKGTHYKTEDGIIRKLERELKAIDKCMGCGATGVKTSDKRGHFPWCKYRK